MAFLFDPDDSPTPACHAPTIVASGDRLVAAWFAGSHEKHPDVGIWTATFEGERWSPPQQVADGKAAARQPPRDSADARSSAPEGGEACWNPVLDQVRGATEQQTDELLLFYKVGPSPGSWRGEVLKSTDAGETWRPEPKLPAGFIGPIKNKPLTLANGDLLCPSSRESGHWRCHFERLSRIWVVGSDVVDTLAAEHPVPDLHGFGAIQPAVFRGATGFEALVRTRRGIVASTRSADGANWTPLAATPLPNPNAGIDAANLPDGRIALVCNPTTVPSGRWGGPRTPLAVAVRDDDRNWRLSKVLEDGAGEFSYPAIICSDQLHILYTCRRRTIRHVRIDPATL